MHWLKNWQKGRAQRVVVHGADKVICHIPQDSNLGPVQFNVFIHDQEAGLECTISMFADSTNLKVAFDS